ncbi:MAG TPA: hypothetical protein VF820_05835 [Patescibacteria group bacterium]
MCYECGCNEPTVVISPDSITEDTFKKAAKGAKISVEEAKRNTLELLTKELGNQ